MKNNSAVFKYLQERRMDKLALPKNTECKAASLIAHKLGDRNNHFIRNSKTSAHLKNHKMTEKVGRGFSFGLETQFGAFGKN